MDNLELEERLTLQEVTPLTPSIEEFSDELSYLNSGKVREYGARFGIVKTVCPVEYEPFDPEMKQMRKLQHSMAVLEQRLVRVNQPGKRCKTKLPVYNVERRQYEAYETSAKDFQRVGNQQREKTEKLACQKYGKQKYQAMSLRDKYWATRDLQACAAYGADIDGTLMRKDLQYWNFGSKNFPCLTRRYCTLRTPGVYSPYLYIGNWGTTFPLHIEDHDLYSVNYLHDGLPKVWYSIPNTGSYASQVEELAKELSKTEADVCPNFLRHKTLMIHPDLFLERGIPVYTTEQKVGEMIITFPKAYHFGFNSGFNVAEARNIATKDWIPVGLKVEKCTCSNSVSPTIDRNRLLEMAVEAYEDQLDQLTDLTPEDLEYCTKLLQKRMKKRTGHKASSSSPSAQGTIESSKKIKHNNDDQV